MSNSKEDKGANQPIWIGLKAHELPDFVETKGSDWVKYGKKDDYPQELINMFNNSTINNAIITGKVHYIAGAGVKIDKTKLHSVEQIAAAERAVKFANPSESLDKVMSKSALDLELGNAIALEVIWKPNGKFDLYHVDWSKIRISADEERFAYSPDWTKIKQDTPANREKGFKTFDKFDKTKRKGSQLLYFTVHRAGQKYYSLPEYIGAVPYIQIDHKIAEYHYNNLENGFMAGNVLLMSGQYPGAEAAKANAKSIRDKFQGTNAKEAGGIVIIYQEEGEGQTTIESLMPNNFDKQFMQLLDQTKSMIFTGHKVTSPALFGVETDSSFGNRTEIIEKMEVFQSNYVDARQKILNDIIFELYGIDAIEMDRLQPISEQLSEQALLQIATTAELRNKAGLEQLEAEAAGNNVADALGTISPLVATKVLETMTAEEIRSIVGLTGGMTTTATTTTTPKFSADPNEEQMLLLLSKFGRSAEGVNAKFTKELHFTSEDDIDLDEDAFKLSFAVNDFDNSVLGILRDNPTLPPKDIAEALDSTTERVENSIKKLAADKLIKISEVIGGEGQETSRELTPEGTKQAEPIELEVVYRYVKRADAGGADVIAGTRDFCRRLISMNRLYTKEEIDQISLLTQRNVWLRRGGFWNRGKGKTISPSCRHIWRQELIQKTS